ncbi:MAG: glycoside hydrolase family 25 protein [Bacteroidaceae bacterium]|nr:glycoside hydrolase family 25 protein [Bacteroidaceae bacterium]
MAASIGKSKKKKRVSVPKKKGRKPFYMLPDWLHWLVTILLILIVSAGAYYLFLRPYFYRLRPCQGAREYGVCLPSGFLYYGIDVSHHQGKIDWSKVAELSALNGYPVRFVIMKATEGSTFTDPEYLDNIRDAREAGFVCGVYHFYDPCVSPDKQAEHYMNTVKLQKGDLVPVVDVERSGRSSGDLQRELSVFLGLLESHYGVKPIIYASTKFRRRHLNSTAFDRYPFWVAHYYVVRPETVKPWIIWQFTDHASVEGINGHTDFNVFKGTEADFNALRLK